MRYPQCPYLVPWLLLVASPVGSSVPAAAQEYSGDNSGTNRTIDFNQVISARAYPPTLKLQNLNSQWRRFTLSDTGETNMGRRMAMQMRVMERLGVGVYYTRGETVTMATQTYLVAYRIDNELNQQDLQGAVQELFGGQNQALTGPIKFMPDTKLALSLLNLRTTGSINDVTKFDPAVEIMNAGDITAASTDNLRRLGQVLQQVSRRQPLPLRDVRTMQRAFQNRMHNNSLRLFVHPQTKEPYQVNTRLADKRSTQLSNPARIVAIYEAKPGTDNKRGVVFLDGHVERVPESNWAKVLGTTEAVAKTKMPKGLVIQDLRNGTGLPAQRGDNLVMHYRATLLNGRRLHASYDRGQPFLFQLGAGQVMKGLEYGLIGMRARGKRRIIVPSYLAYDNTSPKSNIPPNSTIVYEVELISVQS